MKKYSFEFVLSHQSMQNFIKELKDYQKELEKSKKYILEALAEYTQERVKHYISESVGNGGYPTTDKLLDSIEISGITGDMIRVYTELAYAKFVEFGTGVTAKNNPHPYSSNFGWSYDINERGEKGWVYKSSDGNFYWTQGEEAHQFMYRAWMDLKANYMIITKQVLRERGIIK